MTSELDLTSNYLSEQDPPFGRRLGDRLGASVTSIRRLAETISGDLDEAAFGVRWWTTYKLSTAQRTLIGDQLLSATLGVEGNLVEARLHLHEFSHANDAATRLIDGSLYRDEKNEWQFKHPKIVGPQQDLVYAMMDLHLTGLFRALWSAMDCLGGVIIGVGGLKTPLREASLKTALGAIKNISATDQGNAASEQRAFGIKLNDALVTAGPPEWDKWVDFYRNMLVHRGRQLSTFALKPTVVAGEIHNPANFVLSNSPQLSDVESIVAQPKRRVLTELAATTLQGAYESTVKFANSVGEAALELWTKRQKDPALIEQPDSQWKDGRSAKLLAFDGYDPNSFQWQGQSGTAHPTVSRRLAAAALSPADISKWSTFD